MGKMEQSYLEQDKFMLLNNKNSSVSFERRNMNGIFIKL